MLKNEFNQRWGWFELLHAVSEYLMLDMIAGMKQPAMLIMMYATLLKEKVKVIKK